MNKFLAKIAGVVASIAMVIGVGVGVASKQARPTYADPDVSTLTFTSACGGSGTADDGAVWTVTSNGTESNFDSDRGIHYGTKSASVQYIALSTDDIVGTITQVVVNASDAQGTSVITVTVGESTLTPSGSSTVTNSNPGEDYTFTGSASGEITVDIRRPSNTTKAIYCKSIAVTYSSSGGGQQGPTTYSVTYHDNNKTSGTVPVDNNTYETGESVTVLGNTGSLERTGYTWSGWSLNQDGSGTAYGPTYTESYVVGTSNIHFYPIWTEYVAPLPEEGTISITGVNPLINGSYGTDVEYVVAEDNTPYSRFGFNCTQVQKYNEELQFKANAGVLYSTTPLSYIRSVTIDGSTNTAGAEIKYGTGPNSECTSSSVGTRNTYFKVSNVSGNAGRWTITVTYSLEDPAVLTNLRIYSGEDTVEKEYEEGEVFDSTGLVIQAEWDNEWDTVHNVVDDVVWTPEPLTKGTTTVTGTYTAADVSKTVSVTGLTVTGPDAVLDKTNNPFTSTSNSNTAEGNVTVGGIEYHNYAGYLYNNNYLAFNKGRNGYIGNNTAFAKNIQKIVVDYQSGGSSYFTMYEGTSALAESYTISPSATSTGRITYTFNDENQFFKLKLTTTGTYCNINSIAVYLGSTHVTYEITEVIAEVEDATYYAGSTLSASNFNLTVKWTNGKGDTNPTEGFTWTVNGDENGQLNPGNNEVIVTYQGVSSSPINVVGTVIHAESVNIEETAINLAPTESVTLHGSITPANAVETISWSSNNEAVATVNSSGVVTAVAVGSTTITATAGEQTDTCTVNVVAPNFVKVNALQNGKKYIFAAYGYSNETSSNMYYLPAATATKASNPAAVQITSLLNLTKANAWDVTIDASSHITISNTVGNNKYYLTATDTAQGIAVTSSNEGYWTLNANGLTYSDDGNRYLAMYNNADFRYYTVPVNASNKQSIVDLFYEYIPTAQDNVEDTKTRATLSYSDYHDAGNDTFTFDNIAIRFGGTIDADIFEALENVTGYGVLVTTKEYLDAQEGDNKSLKNHIDSSNANIQKYDSSATTSGAKTTPTKYGNLYKWNVYYQLPSSVEEELTRTYVSVAYIKTSSGTVFFKQVEASAQSLALDLIDSNTYATDQFGGSLYYLATLGL